MAPPTNPGPKPHQNPRPHTGTMSVPAAFLIASASARGIADAIWDAVAAPAASTAATDMFSIRLDISFLPCFAIRPTGMAYRDAPSGTCRRYGTEMRPV